MSFGGPLGGWSERHCLGVADIATAKTQATLITNWRVALLPATLALLRSKISVLGKPRDRKLLPFPYPVAGTYSISSGSPPVITAGTNVVNIDDDCLKYTEETPFGAFNNRVLHGLPDIEVANDVLANGVTIAGAIPGTIPVPPAATWEAMVGDYFAVLKANTVFFREYVDPTTGDTVLQQTSIDTIIMTSLGTKKVGKKFGQQRGRQNPR